MESGGKKGLERVKNKNGGVFNSGKALPPLRARRPPRRRRGSIGEGDRSVTRFLERGQSLSLKKEGGKREKVF